MGELLQKLNKIEIISFQEINLYETSFSKKGVKESKKTNFS